MGDSIPLVDLKARNHDIECGDLNRIHDTNGSIVQQILISVVQAMRGLFWDPFTSESYTTIRSLKALNKQTREPAGAIGGHLQRQRLQSQLRFRVHARRRH